MRKIYCYADESGQDSEGRLFIVGVIISDGEQRKEIERKLVSLESTSGKRKTKWKKTHYRIKEKYLQELKTFKELQSNIFYATYSNTKDYIRLTAEAVAGAIKERVKGKYVVTVEIDGLNPNERRKTTKVLKEVGIRYRKVRGVRDESSVFVRLADAIAGFVYDAYKEKPYTQNLYSNLKQQGFLTEIKNTGVSGSSNPA